MYFNVRPAGTFRSNATEIFTKSFAELFHCAVAEALREGRRPFFKRFGNDTSRNRQEISPLRGAVWQASKIIEQVKLLRIQLQGAVTKVRRTIVW